MNYSQAHLVDRLKERRRHKTRRKSTQCFLFSLFSQTKKDKINCPLFFKNPTSPALSCRRSRLLLAGGGVKQYESRCFSQWWQGQLLCHDEMHSIWSRGSQILSLCLSVWWFRRLLLCSYSGNFQIVALANLIPADDAIDELDSYMYQTVSFFSLHFLFKCWKRIWWHFCEQERS